MILMWAQGREPLDKITQQANWVQNYVESLPEFSHWFVGVGESPLTEPAMTTNLRSKLGCSCSLRKKQRQPVSILPTCISIYCHPENTIKMVVFWLRLLACGILLPRPGIKPMFLQGNHRVLTTRHPGKSPSNILEVVKVLPKIRQNQAFGGRGEVVTEIALMSFCHKTESLRCMSKTNVTLNQL